MVVSNIFYFHPYLGKILILTNIFQVGWNHQPEKEGGSFSSFFRRMVAGRLEGKATYVTFHGSSRVNDHYHSYPCPMDKNWLGAGKIAHSQWSNITLQTLGSTNMAFVKKQNPDVYWHLGVSKNKGTPKWMGLQWKTLLKWMIWGKPTIFGNIHLQPQDAIVTIRIATFFFGIGRWPIYAFIPSHPKMYRIETNGFFAPENSLSPKIKGSSNQIASIVQSGAIFSRNSRFVPGMDFLGNNPPTDGTTMD